MKKLISLLLMAVLLITSAGAVDLYIDTNLVETDTPPTIVDGRTLVPLRAIFEALGAEVSWDQDTQTATGTKGDIVVMIQIDNPTAYVNGEARELDVPAQIINDRTMVPARFISEAMKCEVTWYSPTQTAAVADKLKGQQLYATETGERYHFNHDCNGGTYYEATLAEAMGRKLTLCENCTLTHSYWHAPAEPEETTPSYSVTIRNLHPDTIVYVSNRSNTIHSVSDCSGMKNYREMTLGEADARGYKYCPNCF